MPTLLEIAQGRQIPLTAGIMQAVKTDAPALAAFDTRTSSDTKFMALAMTALPEASGFKDYGEGFTASNARLELREFDAKFLGAKVEVPKHTAARWDATHASSGTTYFDLQVMATMSAEMRNLERTIFYGTVQDAKGFPGLKQLTPYASANLYALTDNPEDDDCIRSVINAGGSTANTASSVYSVIHGEMDCQLVACNDFGGELFAMSEPITQHIAPNSDLPTATLPYLITDISGHFGVSVSGMNQTPNSRVPTQYSVRRLANLTNDSGAKLTGEMLDLLIDSHGGKQPSALYMSKRSGRQLAKDGGATDVFVSLGGGGDAKNTATRKQAEAPLYWGKIPIIYTPAIKNNDAINS